MKKAQNEIQNSRGKSSLIIKISAISLFTALASCETNDNNSKSVSLERARSITADFQNRQLSPPKSVSDITTVLDQQPETPHEEVVKARSIISRAEPRSSSNTDLAKFYREKGYAARTLNRDRESLEYFKKSAKLARNTSFEHWAYNDVAISEIQMGKYGTATKALEKAISLIPANLRGLELSWTSVLGSLKARAGDLKGALEAVDRADSIIAEADAGGYLDRLGRIWKMHYDRTKARILKAQGKYDEANPHFLSSLRALERGVYRGSAFRRPKMVRDVTRLAYADNLALQGQAIKAEIAVRRALKDTITRAGRYSPETATILDGFIGILSVQGRFVDAEKLAIATMDIYKKIGVPTDSYALGRVQSRLADVYASQGKWKQARQEFQNVAKNFEEEADVLEGLIGRTGNLPLSQLRTGDLSGAELAARRMYKTRNEIFGTRHYETAEALGILGLALFRQGKITESFNAFRQAMPVLEERARRASGEIGGRAAQDFRMRIIFEGYLALLLSDDIDVPAADRNRLQMEAFRIAELTRSRSVQRALSRSTARAAAKDPDLSDLVRREQDALTHSSAMKSLLVEAFKREPGSARSRLVETLQSEIEQLDSARLTLTREIERRFPKYSSLMNPTLISIEETRKALQPREVLISTYVSESSTYIWSVPKQGKWKFWSTPIGRTKINEVVQNIRRGLDLNVTRVGEIPEFDVKLAYDLYRKLLDPIADTWKDADDLLIVSHGPLGQLPFSLLVTEPHKLSAEARPLFSRYREVPWLIRNHTVTVLPSVSSLVSLRSSSILQTERREFIGFADPYFSKNQAPAPDRRAAPVQRTAPARTASLQIRARPDALADNNADISVLPRLPETASEIIDIARVMKADPDRDIFVGERASESQVKSANLSGYKIVAFATHGLIPGELKGLSEPALALSSPEVVGGEEDGLLTMGEVLGLKLNADWVILSACNTAAGDGRGAEAVSGLGRAFFYAGTRAVLVSNWPVETNSAKELTIETFKRLANLQNKKRASALQQAMISMIDQKGLVGVDGKVIYSWAHPVFWAPFTVVGDGANGNVPTADIKISRRE